MMQIDIQMNDTGRRVLAVYIQVTEDEVAKTVEIEPDVVYVDENSKGELVGVEMLAPGQVQFVEGLPAKLRKKYKTKGLPGAFRTAANALATH